MTTRVYTDADIENKIKSADYWNDIEQRDMLLSLLAERKAAQPDTKDVPFGYVSSKAPFGIDRSSFRTVPAPHWDIPLYLRPQQPDTDALGAAYSLGRADERAEIDSRGEGANPDWLIPMARRALHIAFVWNDHNYPSCRKMALDTAEEYGIKSFKDANTVLKSVYAATPRLADTGKEVCDGCGSDHLQTKCFHCDNEWDTNQDTSALLRPAAKD